MGISPDIIVLRCDEPIEDENIFRKIANFCNVESDCVIENMTIPVLYEAPLMLEKAHMGDTVCRKLGLGQPKADLAEWEEMVSRIHGRTKRVPIALVGKYTQLHDAYLSVIEALRHAGYTVGTHVAIRWVDSETLTEENLEEKLGGVCGILVRAVSATAASRA